MPPKKKVERPAQENISLGPQVREGRSHQASLSYTHLLSVIFLTLSDSCIGELVFGVARIFASFNDTFVHVTDLRYIVPVQCLPQQYHFVEPGGRELRGATWLTRYDS